MHDHMAQTHYYEEAATVAFANLPQQPSAEKIQL